MAFPLTKIIFSPPDEGLQTMFTKVNSGLDILNNPALPFVDVTDGKTLVATDAGKAQLVDSSDPETITIPLNSSVAFEVKVTWIPIIGLGTGTVSITAASGVDLNGVDGGSTDIIAQYQSATIVKVGTDAWIVMGSIGSVS